uniref:Ig-like domain-containing protein n=1 Tax=Oryzias sinensis TaxID=183150 RepID=A0A8C8A7Y9_9TELE
MELFFCFPDFCHGVEIQQPSSVFGRDGDPSVTLTCKQDDSQFFYMFWYRQRGGGGRMELLVYSPGASVANVEAPFNGSKYSAFRPTVLASSLQVQAVEAADAAVYFYSLCSYNEAYFGAGTKLTVLDLKVTAPTRVKVLSPSEKECSSGKKTLVCVASGFYPDHVSVSWMINGGAVSKGVATDSAATRQNRTYRITSRSRRHLKPAEAFGAQDVVRSSLQPPLCTGSFH